MGLLLTVFLTETRRFLMSDILQEIMGILLSKNLREKKWTQIVGGAQTKLGIRVNTEECGSSRNSIVD